MAERMAVAGKALPVSNLIAFVVVAVINGVFSAGVASQYSIGDVSRMYETLITPANYAFSIWGLIYFALAVFVIWQLLPSIRDDHLVFDRIGYWFVVSCVLNCAWIVCFVQGSPVGWIWTSSVLLFCLSGSLLAIVLRTRAWVRALPSATAQQPGDPNDGEEQRPERKGVLLSCLDYFAVDFAFSTYCAWCTVASILNVVCSLVGSGFYGGGWGQDVWAILILVVAALVFLAMVVLKWNWAYGLVFTWAAVAISRADQCGGRVRTEGSAFSDDEACRRVQMCALCLGVVVAVASLLRLGMMLERVLAASPHEAQRVRPRTRARAPARAADCAHIPSYSH